MLYIISIIVGLVATLTVEASPLLTAPEVAQWRFRVESGFVVTATTALSPGEVAYWLDPVSGTVPRQLAPGLTGSDPSVEPTFVGAPTTLFWGNGSSLSVGGATGGHHAGIMTTDGGMVDTVTIQFVNGLNDGSRPALTYAGLLDGIWIDPIAPASFYESGIPGTGENHEPLLWNMYIVDTVDAPGCLTPGCADIAIIDLPGMTFSPERGMFSGKLDYFGHTYLVLLEVEGLSPLDSSVCGLIGKSSCVGTLLPEGRTQTFQVRVGIESVPGPATAWLIGGGLGLIGVFRPRRG